MSMMSLADDASISEIYFIILILYSEQLEMCVTKMVVQYYDYLVSLYSYYYYFLTSIS